jgi:t-SNARE complex subunit (syntaxin)
MDLQDSIVSAEDSLQHVRIKIRLTRDATTDTNQDLQKGIVKKKRRTKVKRFLFFLVFLVLFFIFVYLMAKLLESLGTFASKKRPD